MPDPTPDGPRRARPLAAGARHASAGRSAISRWATDLLAIGPAQGRRAGVELGGLFLLVALIGLADRATGYEVRFGVFYLVPVSVATVRRGPGAALGLTLMASLVGIGPAGPFDGDWTVAIVNLAFRFSMLAFVVGLLSLLVGAIAEARASDRRSREFLQYAAHQLRTPTASVSTTAQGLLAAGRRPPDEAALVRLVTESNRMGRLVAAMLRFLRLERGEAVSGEAGDLRAIAASEVERWADVAVPARLRLDLPEGSEPLLVPSDAVREVLALLIDNAARHAQTVISVQVTADDATVRIRIRDDGPGLPVGQEDRAFEPFVTLDGAGGSGLGLTIAARLLEAVGGDLRYADGAFSARLPRLALDAAPAPVRRAQEAGIAG